MERTLKYKQDILKQWISSTGMTRKQFAAKFGKSERYIYKMINRPTIMMYHDTKLFAKLTGKTEIQVAQLILG